MCAHSACATAELEGLADSYTQQLQANSELMSILQARRTQPRALGWLLAYGHSANARSAAAGAAEASTIVDEVKSETQLRMRGAQALPRLVNGLPSALEMMEASLRGVRKRQPHDQSAQSSVAEVECASLFKRAVSDTGLMVADGRTANALSHLQHAHRLLRQLGAPVWLLLRIRVVALVYQVRALKPNSYMSHLLSASAHVHRQTPQSSRLVRPLLRYCTTHCKLIMSLRRCDA